MLVDLWELIRSGGFRRLVASSALLLAAFLWWWHGGPFRKLRKAPDDEDARWAFFYEMRRRVERPGIARFYHLGLMEMMNLADHFLDDPDPGGVRGFGRILMLAAVYPLLSAIVCWGICGDAGSLGHALGIAASGNVWFRASVMAWTVGAAVLIIAGMRMGGWKYWAMLALFMVLYKYGLGILHDAFPGEKYEFAVHIAYAFVLSASISILMEHAEGSLFMTLAMILLISGILAAVYYSLAAFPELSRDAETTGMLVGIVILPVVNAIFAWAGALLTREIMRKNFESSLALPRIIFLAGNVLGAFILTAALTAALIAALEGVNIATGRQAVTVSGLVNDLRAHPLAVRHYWLYFMVFVPFLPALLHIGLAIVSFFAVRFPRGWRESLKRRIVLISKAPRFFEDFRARITLRAALTFQWLAACALVAAGFGVLFLFFRELTGLGGVFADGLLRVDALARGVLGV